MKQLNLKQRSVTIIEFFYGIRFISTNSRNRRNRCSRYRFIHPDVRGKMSPLANFINIYTITFEIS